MKAIAASLTAGVLLCVSILGRNGMAQLNYMCDDFAGCPSGCIASDGKCPAGLAMPYEEDTTVTIWSCVPAKQGNCLDTDDLPYCTVSGYSNISMQGMCMNNICGPFTRNALQCH